MKISRTYMSRKLLITYVLMAWFSFMVFNATFNSIFSYIEAVSFIGGENHQPIANHLQTLSHDVVSSTPRTNGVRTHNFSGDKH